VDKVAVMEIKGCGKRRAVLTFYLLPGEPKSKHRVSGLSCGQQGEVSVGRGVLLCMDCATVHGLRPTTPQANAKVAAATKR